MTTASPPPPRRSVLRWLGLGALGAGTAAAGRPAAALQVLPAGDYATIIEAGCGASAYHRQLLEKAQAALGVSLSEDQTKQALAALTCPSCGCPLVAAAATPDQPASSAQ